MNHIIDGLRAQLRDAVYEVGDDGYAEATTPDNSSYPQHPCAVVRPRSAQQVAAVVQAASRGGVTVMVQATGHGAGRRVSSEEVLVDTSALTQVTIDPTTRTANVGAGAMWPAVQQGALPHGLLGLSGTSPTVGVAGYTFGSGVGWLVRKYGLGAAALRSVAYIDGNGLLRLASEDADDPIDREALWAFRGGAPVGIATAIEISLFEVSDLATGSLLWPAESLPAVLQAWSLATGAVSASVTSSMSVLQLPSEGPFPEDLLGTPVVHLSYVSPDGVGCLDSMRAAVRSAAVPVVDTTGTGDIQSLSAIHLDPPGAVPARGAGRWLGPTATDVAAAMFDAARVGRRDGLTMIELRHTESQAVGTDGALTTVPGPFLVHVVGIGVDDDARSRTDDILRQVEAAAGSADIGLAASSFCEGQPIVPDGWSPSVRDRLHTVRDALDPDRVLGFQRHPAP